MISGGAPSPPSTQELSLPVWPQTHADDVDRPIFEDCRSPNRLQDATDSFWCLLGGHAALSITASGDFPVLIGARPGGQTTGDPLPRISRALVPI